MDRGTTLKIRGQLCGILRDCADLHSDCDINWIAEQKTEAIVRIDAFWPKNRRRDPLEREEESDQKWGDPRLSFHQTTPVDKGKTTGGEQVCTFNSLSQKLCYFIFRLFVLPLPTESYFYFFIQDVGRAYQKIEFGTHCGWLTQTHLQHHIHVDTPQGIMTRLSQRNKSQVQINRYGKLMRS